MEHTQNIDAFRDAVIRLILGSQQESPLPPFSLEGRPELKLVQTDISTYGRFAIAVYDHPCCLSSYSTMNGYPEESAMTAVGPPGWSTRQRRSSRNHRLYHRVAAKPDPHRYSYNRRGLNQLAMYGPWSHLLVHAWTT
ncbi:hypothetical protein Mal35_20810 [Gimesia maris]|nr:hypothetical protein Mal35_20810 [Gimesia maris]